jgi:integrase/recombinase XerD
MANKKVTIEIRIKLANGKHSFGKPAYEKTRKKGEEPKLQKLFALVNGEVEEHLEGVYVLRFHKGGKTCRERIKSTEPHLVALAKKKKEVALSEIAAGLTDDAGTATATETVAEAQTLEETAASYLSNVKTMKGKKTYSAYSGAVTGFVRGREMVDLDDLKDPKVGLAAIIAYWEQLQVQGDSDRYISNKIMFLRTFFLKSGLPWPLKKSDMPSYTKKVVKMYNAAELIELMMAATIDEYELFQFFLGAGARDEEVQTACWHNIDFVECKFYVKAKPEYGFKTKSHEERGIPIPDELVALLKARRERYPGTRLIFPSPSGGCETHFLRKLKNLAFKVGLNCGECVSKLKKDKEGNVVGGGESCADAPVCEHWKLHRFRKTFATLHYRSGKVTMLDLQKWLGHKDLETTRLYLADVNDNSPELRATINSTFAFAKVHRATIPQKPARSWRVVGETKRPVKQRKA